MKNWFIVQAAKIKKLGMDKTAAFLTTRMNIALITSLVNALGKEKAMQQIFDFGWNFGYEFILELGANLPTDMSNAPAIGESAWLTFTGQQPKSVKPKNWKIGDFEVYSYILKAEKCVFCEGVTFDGSFCIFAAGAFEGGTQTWIDLTGKPRKALARETKCKAKGDPYCELTVLFVPEEVPIELIRDEHPEWFKEIGSGFKSFDK
ncbi:MAG: hypothetical protein GF308_08355 [Candidatus Heimdallarchaeota archaeon]|nr:hypothetical protein [Candidatus Heimdallarchaeota archaeon]